MAHRIYRLSISPDDLPEVRRVIELDGRASLDDVHEQIVRHYRLDDSDHLYAFFISGRFWDKQTAYFDPRTDGARADRALLFRLNLTPGHVFAYLLDYGMENRFLVTVAAVREAENPLAEPLLVDTAGEVIEGSPDDSEDESDDAPPELAELVALAEAFLDAADELDELEGEPADLPDITAPVLQAAAASALALLSAVDGDRQRFFQLDDWLIQRSLAARLLDLPLALTHVRAFEQAISLARALVFVDRELMEGDLAIVLAKAGRRDEALAQLDQNLSQAQDAVLVEAKAGETHRALADLPAAEAYFRRSLAEAKTKSERLEGMIRVASCLVDQGRDAEANEVLKAARDLEAESAEKPAIPVVGRNEPCPCGSGKKYKKCHGG